MERIETFKDFWPFYLSQHSDRLNRKLHLLGTSLATSLALLSIGLGKFSLLPLALGVGYGFAWAGHFLIEKNRPATFSYPIWSLAGDFKMLFLAARGKLEAEVMAHYHQASN